jgi:predicted TIM-barrel fold metal-dependent hydrolase
LALLERSFGPERLVWGSDWPHTQHEEHVGFETVMAQLRALECSALLMHALMVQAPQALFKF